MRTYKCLRQETRAGALVALVSLRRKVARTCVPGHPRAAAGASSGPHAGQAFSKHEALCTWVMVLTACAGFACVRAEGRSRAQGRLDVLHAHWAESLWGHRNHREGQRLTSWTPMQPCDLLLFTLSGRSQKCQCKHSLRITSCAP